MSSEKGVDRLFLVCWLVEACLSIFSTQLKLSGSGVLVQTHTCHHIFLATIHLARRSSADSSRIPHIGQMKYP
ncbi:hypothetical protein HanPI659440_Chr04g0166661 [Helianthus annuus]|nr:hypothetical protein HanPI659440_Chr04g0166661 [Helianthus annuus]